MFLPLMSQQWSLRIQELVTYTIQCPNLPIIVFVFEDFLLLMFAKQFFVASPDIYPGVVRLSTMIHSMKVK